MDELEKQLKSILDSPGELSRLAEMAQGLLGGAGDAAGSSAGNKERADEGIGPYGRGGDGGAELLKKLAGLLGSGGGGRDKTALIDALAPYVGEKRQKKLRRAASLARAARLAGTLLAENGEKPL